MAWALCGLAHPKPRAILSSSHKISLQSFGSLKFSLATDILLILPPPLQTSNLSLAI
jgi:hypothetical protein